MTTRSSETSADFVPLADRSPGLRISTYRVGADGARYDRTPVVEVESDPGPEAYHPSASWPSCQCPHHRQDEA